ncbi:hypothetical protein A1332_14065 [Methylomonas methanica]|uniref:NACHT domain-containing protein n=1 Tax=Methylomonas methanica TaxID=421 RepID=A0A177MHF1_METMH|nr:hypothetical protein A1332_14065 [Methylomonas methanica]
MSKILLSVREGVEFEAHILDEAPSRDLALLIAELPDDRRLKPVAISAPWSVGPVAIFHMLHLKDGIVAPLRAEFSSVSLSAVNYEIDYEITTIDKVWTHSGLKIEGGISGAPVVSERDDSVVGVACAGADEISYAFFVPLVTLQNEPLSKAQSISQAVYGAMENATRLGRLPNRRGVTLRSWQATRNAVQSLAITGVYERTYAISRPSLQSAIDNFLKSEAIVSILAGASGVGKSASIAYMLRRIRWNRPIMYLRATQFIVNKHPLQEALAHALGLSDTNTLNEFQPFQPPYPLLVIDGLNELTLRKDEWPNFISQELPVFIALLKSKNWKLLLTTRTEHLDIFDHLPDLLKRSLYHPFSEVQDEKPPYEVSHIRLESFNRSEFDELRARYGLPQDIPFAELRHPIVFKIMVEAHGTSESNRIRVREILAEYVRKTVKKIHTRCSNRAPDKIFSIIENWTALKVKMALGYIPSDAINEARDEEIAEAAVAEGLFERVPCGYRYVYDEIFEFVRAKSLAHELLTLTCENLNNVTNVISSSVEGGLTAGIIARALELIENQSPAWVKEFAVKWSSELEVSQTFDLHNQYLAVEILSRVEKGGPLDQVKDILQILRVDKEDGSSNGWGEISNLPKAVSFDHISYAFDLKRAWLMVCNAVKANPNSDSHPFRWKDIGTNYDGSWDSAKFKLENMERYKVLRHMIDGYPKETFAKLVQGLAETVEVGREHSLASFCAQVISIYIDRFPLLEVVRAVVLDNYIPEVVQRLAVNRGEEILELLFHPRLRLYEAPSKTSNCLFTVRSVRPDLTYEVELIAKKMVFDYDAPICLFINLISNFDSDHQCKLIQTRLVAEWNDGLANIMQLDVAMQIGLVSFEEMVEFYSQRLRNGSFTYLGEDMRLMMGNLSNKIRLTIDPILQAQQIDLVIEALCRPCLGQFGYDGYDLIIAAEELLSCILPNKTNPKALLAYINDVCHLYPQNAEILKYFLYARHDDKIAWQSLKCRVCDVIFANVADLDVLASILRHGCEQSHQPEILRYFSESMFRNIGEEAVFKIVVDYISMYREFNFLPEGTICLCQLLKQIAPNTYERYREHLDWVLDDNQQFDL